MDEENNEEREEETNLEPRRSGNLTFVAVRTRTKKRDATCQRARAALAVVERKAEPTKRRQRVRSLPRKTGFDPEPWRYQFENQR